MDDQAKDREKKAAEMKGEGSVAAVNEKQQKQAAATDRDNLQRGVFRMEGTAVKWVPVETGVQDISHIEIKSGLKEGDEVVSGSFGVITRTLKDGMQVTREKPKKDQKK
jgi:HlyD family secretion protein